VGTEGAVFRDFRFQSDSAAFESWSYGDGPDVDTIHRNQVSGACLPVYICDSIPVRV
jgi:hypothetical protein